MRTLYDGVNPDRLPNNAQMVAGYVDGPYKWSSAAWAKFPASVKVHISINPANCIGDVLDVERGDARPDEAPAWAESRRNAGAIPSVYCNASTLEEVERAFRSKGIDEPFYWVAEWNNSASVMPGCIAHQYKNTAGYDISAVADVWPGVDSSPESKPSSPSNGSSGGGATKQAPSSAAFIYQRSLNSMGIRDDSGQSLTVDGICGARTKQAIVKLERIFGLSVDSGIWGSECQHAADACTRAKPTVRYGDYGNYVRYLHYLLWNSIDSESFGPKTQQSVIVFQNRHGLNPDAIVGPLTWAALIRYF